MKKILLFVLLLFNFISLFAVKATPSLLTYKQPDGSEIKYYLHGDECFNFMVSEDGCLLTFDDLGFLVNGEIDNSIIKKSAKKTKLQTVQSQLEHIIKTSQNNVFSVAQRASSNKGYPLSGSPKGLIILVEYKDVPFKSSTVHQDFFNLLNENGYNSGGSTGSARDYFRNASNGVFDPDFVVVGPYTLPNDRKFYGEQEGNRSDKRAGNMIVDACSLADADVDFNDFDENGDGYIDNVFVYYAGHNQAEGGGTNTIWPHRSYILSEYKYDGVILGDYACTSELRGSSGSVMCGIGTFVHEFGHVLSLPDLYDTDYSGHRTLGAWDVMDKGSYNNNGRTPPTYSAYERFFLGWMQPKQLDNDVMIEIEPIAISNTAYLVAAVEHNLVGSNPDPKEFFLLENRTDSNNDGVPSSGLLITRIVYNDVRWNNNTVNNYETNLGVEICCAYGNTDSPYQNVFPGGKRVTDFSFKLRNGTVLDKSLSNITKQGEIITFVYGQLDSIPTISVEGDDLQSFYASVGEEQIKTITIKGQNVLGDLNLSLPSSDYSVRVVDSDDKFVKTLVLPTNSDSTIDVSIEVKFMPQSYSYSNYVSESLQLSTRNFDKAVVLRGCSPRPVFVVPPVAYDAQNISPYTFTAVWDTVFDATEYLLSVYSTTNNDTTYILKDEVVLANNTGQVLYDVKNLQGATEYKYFVRASDRDICGRYENISERSNEILVKTLYGSGEESLTLDVLSQGSDYVVYLSKFEENHSIGIFSIDGKCIATIPVLDNMIVLPKLEKNRVYVLKYMSNVGMKRKSKVVKLYYE